MEQKEELILYQARGLVKMKIYSFIDGGYKNYFGILDQTEQDDTGNLESDKIVVKIGQRLEKALENKVSFSQLINSGKALVCNVYPKTTEDFKLKRFRLNTIYSDELKDLSKLNLFTIRGKVDYIDIEKQIVILRIVPKSSKIKEFDMAVKCQNITHELENLKFGQFWEINAELVDNEFRLQSASMMQEKKEFDNTTYQAPILKSKLVDKAKNKIDNASHIITQEAPTTEPQLINIATDNLTTDMAPLVETQLNKATSTKTKKKKKKTADIAAPEEETDNKTTDLAPIQTPTVETHVAPDVADNKTNKTKKSKTDDVVRTSAPTTETPPVVVTEDKTTNKTAPISEKQLVTEQTPQGSNSQMQVRSEVTIKINGSLPPAAPTPNKKVQIEITDQNGINFTVILNPKSWKKAEASVAQFADWSGMISGKLGKTEQGLEIIDAGIQIFEKKPLVSQGRS